MISYQPSRAPAYAALALLALALAAGFLPVLRMGLEQGLSGLDPYVFRVLRFTLLQAGLSTLLSLALGLPLATVADLGRLPDALPSFGLPEVPASIETLRIIALPALATGGASLWPSVTMTS